MVYWRGAKVDAAVAGQIPISTELGCSGVVERYDWLRSRWGRRVKIRCKEVRLAGRAWVLDWYWREDRCF